MKRSILAALVALLFLPAVAGAQSSNGAFIQYRPATTINSGTTPIFGGATTQVCFNDGGKLSCGDAGFTYAKASDSITLAGPGIFGPGSTVAMGSGSAVANLGGVLNVNTTSQATLGTSEEVLATYTLPANTLSANGKGVRITAWGTVTASTNSKTLRIRFGGVGGTQIAFQVTTTGTHNTWHLNAVVVRTGAATQVSTGVSYIGVGAGSNGVSVTNAAPTQTLSGTVDIVVTGTTPSLAGDATFTGMTVESLN